MKKIVAIGGGTGLANLLAGLKVYTDHISAVVTMTDDGYSSGRLRRDLGILPPGDVRQCLAALASNESLVTKMFQYRFDKGRGISGHSLGNLLLAALEQITGSFQEAVYQASHILAIKGQVLPSTFKEVVLRARLKDGREIMGEYNISREGHRAPIKRIYLKPARIKANPEVIWAIQNAEAVIIGPGSLYTSIIPNLLIREITQIMVKSKAKKIYICNVSTERGETEKYSVEEHIKALIKHSHPKIFDFVLVNETVMHYNDDRGNFGEVANITTDQNRIDRYKIIREDLIDKENPLFHHREKLAQAVMQII